jgi:hypothetical protein
VGFARAFLKFACVKMALIIAALAGRHAIYRHRWGAKNQAGNVLKVAAA